MSGNHTLIMGDRGRIVVPQAVRERHGWESGTPLAIVDTPSGAVLMSADSLVESIRRRISGNDLIGELIADRRASAASENI